MHQLTEAFAKDWSFTTGEDLDEAAFYADPPVVGAAFCRVVTSGPDADLEKIEFAMMQGIALARSSIRIMTPYFLPDERLLTVLAMSAMRGVTIDLVLPKESNHRAIDWARTPNNIPLLDAGVRIWLSEPPFNHSKLMVVDEKWVVHRQRQPGCPQPAPSTSSSTSRCTTPSWRVNWTPSSAPTGTNAMKRSAPGNARSRCASVTPRRA